MTDWKETTWAEFLCRLPPGQESDWLPLTTLTPSHGKLAAADAILCGDTGRCIVEVPAGEYHVAAKVIAYEDETTRPSRIRAVSDLPATLGSEIGSIGVDHWRAAIFDPDAIDRAGATLTDDDGEALQRQIDDIDVLGLVQIATHPEAVLPTVFAGFGDGCYPVYELVRDGERVGLEVVFIGDDAHQNPDQKIITRRSHE